MKKIKKAFINHCMKGILIIETLKEFHSDDFFNEEDMENEIAFHLKKFKKEYGEENILRSERCSKYFISKREEESKKRKMISEKLSNHFIK